MTSLVPSWGLTANWMFDPPVSTPTRRMQANASSRIAWYSTIRQGLRGSDGDRVTCVNPHGVEVLDRADDDAVVRFVTHDLELEFLPTGDRAFDEHRVHRDLPQGL